MARWNWYLLSLTIFVLDYWSKWFATTRLYYGEPVVVQPWLNWLLVHNRGAAFSFMADGGGWQRYFFLLLGGGVGVFLVVALWRLKRSEWQLGLAFTCILGGALGNLADRARFGYVIDFVQLHYQEYYWPAFNLADSAITLGALLWLWHLWFGQHRDSETTA
ncbi:MAG: signal peptidase II [Gammaproteobacteria bacterium]|nr:signal peptidase II [Gammaproteobacteria bacterium]